MKEAGTRRRRVRALRRSRRSSANSPRHSPTGDRDGVFGVPTFIVDGEPFLGKRSRRMDRQEARRNGPEEIGADDRVPVLRADRPSILFFKMFANSIVQGIGRVDTQKLL